MHFDKAMYEAKTERRSAAFGGPTLENHPRFHVITGESLQFESRKKKSFRKMSVMSNLTRNYTPFRRNCQFFGSQSETDHSLSGLTHDKQIRF